MKVFKGRIITAGEWSGEAVVSKEVVNIMNTYYKSAYKSSKMAIAGDANNKDLFGQNLTGKALCLPHCDSSSNNGLLIQTICSMHINPSAFLFSKQIDEVAASGIILAKVWEDSDIICIDNLGDEFLNKVSTGDEIEIKKDGSVIIKNKD